MFEMLQLTSDGENDEADDSDSEADSDTSSSAVSDLEQMWSANFQFDGTSEHVEAAPQSSSSASLSESDADYATPSRALRPSDFDDINAFFLHIGSPTPTMPTTNRTIEDLLEAGDLWSMSFNERKRLHDHWHFRVRDQTHNEQLEEFTRLRDQHSEAKQRYLEGQDTVCQRLICQCQIYLNPGTRLD
jgi:hypothetical protein